MVFAELGLRDPTPRKKARSTVAPIQGQKPPGTTMLPLTP